MSFWRKLLVYGAPSALAGGGIVYTAMRDRDAWEDPLPRISITREVDLDRDGTKEKLKFPSRVLTYPEMKRDEFEYKMGDVKIKKRTADYGNSFGGYYVEITSLNNSGEQVVHRFIENDKNKLADIIRYLKSHNRYGLRNFARGRRNTGYTIVQGRRLDFMDVESRNNNMNTPDDPSDDVAENVYNLPMSAFEPIVDIDANTGVAISPDADPDSPLSDSYLLRLLETEGYIKRDELVHAVAEGEQSVRDYVSTALSTVLSKRQVQEMLREYPTKAELQADIDAIDIENHPKIQEINNRLDNLYDAVEERVPKTQLEKQLEELKRLVGKSPNTDAVQKQLEDLRVKMGRYDPDVPGSVARYLKSDEFLGSEAFEEAMKKAARDAADKLLRGESNVGRAIGRIKGAKGPKK